ncbi:hypothetical protein [Nocardioides sp. Arc9.136]|uniref:DUF7620 family protein n=1 Tax=Nocardioides sp. Arc9.136 TaxID=2996826 RepID=UPI002665FB48|nr:hypothetical protein [Nocardioides sp. Arc9.136]WKN47160.1 hypothetical protein OSR43_14040 [Nocardioides sp. Arc9.136]
MKWFRRRRTPDRESEATRARQRAQAELERVRAETPEYEALSDSLRSEIREKNHLTELFLSIHHGRG